MFRKDIKKLVLLAMLCCVLPCCAECIKSKCSRPIPDAVMNYKNYSNNPHHGVCYYTDWNGYEVYRSYYRRTADEIAKHGNMPPIVGRPMYYLYDGNIVRFATREEADILDLEHPKVNQVCGQLRQYSKD